MHNSYVGRCRILHNIIIILTIRFKKRFQIASIERMGQVE